MMKRVTIVLLLIIASVTGCRKSSVPVLENDGQVKIIGYACGPACDAMTYSVLIDGKYYIPSSALADEFKIHDLNIHLRYKTTGRFPELWKGPSNVEIIEILTIIKR